MGEATVGVVVAEAGLPGDEGVVVSDRADGYHRTAPMVVVVVVVVDRNVTSPLYVKFVEKQIMAHGNVGIASMRSILVHPDSIITLQLCILVTPLILIRTGTLTLELVLM
ncbi:unnamed protein product [Cuscuta campestris]|uniref:Uncharacterized protein n=1 Tax=Cuscuta campestris TaxID=132261 RepID=A0A484LL22_9ASTE|nr:unnamed protein product [Cuscuta campestris]